MKLFLRTYGNVITETPVEIWSLAQDQLIEKTKGALANALDHLILGDFIEIEVERVE